MLMRCTETQLLFLCVFSQSCRQTFTRKQVTEMISDAYHVVTVSTLLLLM